MGRNAGTLVIHAKTDQHYQTEMMIWNDLPQRVQLILLQSYHFVTDFDRLLLQVILKF